MIAIVDYGMGNVGNVERALVTLGYEAKLTDCVEELRAAEAIILPGVGSFTAAIKEIDQRGLRDVLQEIARQKPFIGICLGMQLLVEYGEEGGGTSGLGLLPGTVRFIRSELPLPHMGWNQLHREQGNVAEKYVYFVHSYMVDTSSDWIIATTDYGEKIPAIIQQNNVIGIQFHPEKSGENGLRILKQALEGGFVSDENMAGNRSI
ncbi:imidazole glycerol phosphate synthase subunit HisH [Risungbinella massiliensis]|uniref:imidazole glycerol phosphate synthase subunit HisH n=1 Tax=Risungbinella massiliensis TaxID=1329796 RepID=UPI0005CBB11D|nr:imidazole glycerol phosphate synthase subunit HisH [Risungbinella massiliensis]